MTAIRRDWTIPVSAATSVLIAALLGINAVYQRTSSDVAKQKDVERSAEEIAAFKKGLGIVIAEKARRNCWQVEGDLPIGRQIQPLAIGGNAPTSCIVNSKGTQYALVGVKGGFSQVIFNYTPIDIQKGVQQ